MPVSVVPDPQAGSAFCCRILVIDDSAATRIQVRKSLTAAGMKVSEASEGREGLRKAQTEAFDLIVTDLHMPTMDGLDFIRELRTLPNYKTVPVLVLTSDHSKERLREGRKAGATGWLIKPPNVEALAKTIRLAIAKNS